MNTNFVDRQNECVDYIYKKTLENKTNQEIVDNFLAVYSKKYLGDKHILKDTLYNYADTKNFEVDPEVIFDPKLLLLSNGAVDEVSGYLKKKERIYEVFIHNLSYIYISGYQANFGFIVSSNSLDKRSFFGYVSLDQTILTRTPENIINSLYDVAFLANHDFIHGLSLGNEVTKSKLFQGNIANTLDMSNYEYMSLCFHYTLFQDIYDKHPEVKEKVISNALQFVKDIEENKTLISEESNYLIGVYIYFLRRVLSPNDWPREVKKHLTSLIISDSYPSGGNVIENSIGVAEVYKGLQEGKTIIPEADE